MHVGQHPRGRARPRDPFERKGKVGMGRVRRAAQRVKHPAVEPLEVAPGRLGDGADVGQIGQPADAEAERVDIAMLDPERGEADRPAGAVDLEQAVDRAQLADRVIVAVGRLHEGIAEAVDQRLLGVAVGPDRQAAAHVEGDLAQVIEPVHVIGMAVGVDHGVKLAHARAQQLRAHVGRGVDQHPGDARGRHPLDQHRAARAAVLRIVGVALAPDPADARHAAGGAAAEDGETHAGHRAALVKRRSKLAEVAAAKAA
ncbi:hypothetical protein SDC9_41031 [bioreactor metagenome]|uniref:Uncharacterized protein n=1 Tax=bioreactor metagenome TaxID=1076179 RepID=A0A644VWR1_9ZZZZ